MLKSEGFYLCLLFCCSDVECDDSVILLEDENEGDSLASATPELGHSRNVFSSQFGAPGSSRSIGPSSEGRESQTRVVQSERFQFSHSGDYDMPSQPTQSRLSGTLSSQPGPSELSGTSHSCPSGALPSLPGPSNTSPKDVDKLLSMFSSRFSVKQIQVLFRYSGDCFDDCIDCLMSGPTLEAILRMVNTHSLSYPVVKVPIDSNDMWADMLALYKNCADDFLGKRIRVTLNNSPVIDTCGVRKHVYTSVFAEFVNNKHVHLFDGPPNYVRPLYSAEARCSGLFKVLGTMVGHSIILDGIGFPYFSPVSYWYIVSGEEKALEYVNISDVGKDTAYAVTKVQFM